LVEQQSIYSLLQGLTWNSGTYEFSPLKLQNAQTPIVKYQELLQAVHALFEVSASTLRMAMFDNLEIWHPDSKTVELSRFPLWVILAASRRLGLNGILSVRRQNKLYEIVLKYGVPLTLYEGTFGHPRQMIVVRQASDEHERFFVEQLFKLFSFLTGTVYFRNLSEQPVHEKTDESHLQFRDETLVTKSVSPDEIQAELSAEFLRSKSVGFQLLYYLKQRLRAYLFHMKKLILRAWRKNVLKRR